MGDWKSPKIRNMVFLHLCLVFWYEYIEVHDDAIMLYGCGCGGPSIRGGLGCIHNGYGGYYGEGNSLLGKVIHHVIASVVVVALDNLDMWFLCGVGDELYNCSNEEFVLVVLMRVWGCLWRISIECNFHHILNKI